MVNRKARQRRGRPLNSSSSSSRRGSSAVMLTGARRGWWASIRRRWLWRRSVADRTGFFPQPLTTTARSQVSSVLLSRTRLDIAAHSCFFCVYLSHSPPVRHIWPKRNDHKQLLMMRIVSVSSGNLVYYWPAYTHSVGGPDYSGRGRLSASVVCRCRL